MMGGMRSPLSLVPDPRRSSVVFGDPHTTADGTTVIEVSRVRRGRSGEELATTIGIYTIHEGKATWCPAVDGDRIALIGVTTGFAAAVLGCIAVIRRPPWPALTGTITWPGRN